MTKRVDYLISAVSYDPNREITEVQAHEYRDGVMGQPEWLDKITVSHNIRKGKTFVTIFRMLNSWKIGKMIRMYSVNGNPYLRIDENRVRMDYLGDIPNIDISKKKEHSRTYTAPTSEEITAPSTINEPRVEIEKGSRSPPQKPDAVEPKAVPKTDVRPQNNAPNTEDKTIESKSRTAREPRSQKPDNATVQGSQDAKSSMSDKIFMEKKFPALKKIINSIEGKITKTDREPKPGVVSFVDPEKSPEYYVRRFMIEPQYKEWFNRNYPDHTMYQAIGISEKEFKKIADRVMPEFEPPETPATSKTKDMAQPVEDSQSNVKETGVEVKEEPGVKSKDIVLETPHGTMPAEGEIQVPFEEMQPEEVKAEVLEVKAESEDTVGVETPHGTMPAEGEIQVPFEEMQPEEVKAEVLEVKAEVPELQVEDAFKSEPPEDHTSNEESTLEDDEIDEQYARIAKLSDQIKELETALANRSSNKPEDTPEVKQEDTQEDKPDTVQGMINEFTESSEKQIRQLEMLEKHIEDIENLDLESKLVKKMRRQMKKLTAIEEKIAKSQEPTQEQLDYVEELERKIAELERIKSRPKVIAYCVKCKDKRDVSEPEQVVLKNGRTAIRGVCSVCGTKIFKFVSKKTK